jgi:uncharacterized Zn finger protein
LARARKTIQQDRAAEYIDSPMMTQRVRFKKQLSAQIDGRYGTYRTQAKLTGRIDGQCTCPSEWWPCKHVRALRATWDRSPESFLDLEQCLRKVATQPKARLVAAIRQMVLKSPQCLTVLGIAGFDERTEEEGSNY